MIANLIQLGLAYVLALPMAIEREKHTRSAGLRTFPLVSIACCGFVLTGRSAFGDGDAISRVLYGLMTGIGFIGGGAILKHDGGNVRGMATAASIWATGGIGAAVGFESYDVAIALSAVTAATLFFTPAMKEKLEE